MKLNSIALVSKSIIKNVFFPNIMNFTTIPPTRQLLIPIVFFTKEDPFSSRISSFVDEIEEIKTHVRTLLKTHMKASRVHIVTDTIYLQNNLTLHNSIRSTFIDSISLVNQNNSIQYQTYRKIVFPIFDIDL